MILTIERNVRLLIRPEKSQASRKKCHGKPEKSQDWKTETRVALGLQHVFGPYKRLNDIGNVLAACSPVNTPPPPTRGAGEMRASALRAKPSVASRQVPGGAGGGVPDSHRARAGPPLLEERVDQVVGCDQAAGPGGAAVLLRAVAGPPPIS